MKFREMIGLAARIVVGGVLVYAGFLKAAGPSAEFAAAVAAYKILPGAWISPFALAVPYFEMWVGLFVFTGLFTRQASLAAAVLFIVFLAVLGSAQVRGIDLVSCGCFGADAMSPHHTMMMDTALFVLAVISQRINRFSPPWSLDRILQ